jgi:hypothetical protein
MAAPPSDWSAFGTGERDAQCDAERLAATQYVLQRLNGLILRGHIEEDLLNGMGMALTQLVFGVNGNAPTEQSRQGLHELLDLWWMMCASHPASLDGATKQ